MVTDPFIFMLMKDWAVNDFDSAILSLFVGKLCYIEVQSIALRRRW